MIRLLGAVGTLVWDRIWHPSGAGAPREQWGGAAYSLAALSAACPPGWRIDPLVKVGADLWDPAESLLRDLAGVEAGDGVRRVPEPNNRVELRYHDPAHRCEILTGGVPAWTADELLPRLERLDALYVNFLSGFELDLETALAVRRAFPGPIYADLHSLFLGPPGHGPREPRPLPAWERWLACFDAVQLNRDELALLGLPPGEAHRLLEHGPSLVLVTRGEEGAVAVAREDLPPDPLAWPRASTAPPVALEAPLPGGPVAGDPTGCGDVWGGVLFAGLLSGIPLPRALERAHRAAARKVREPATARLRDALARELAVPLAPPT